MQFLITYAIQMNYDSKKRLRGTVQNNKNTNLKWKIRSYISYRFDTLVQYIYTYGFLIHICLVLSTRSYTSFTQIINISRWRHQMETFSALLALCAGNSPVTGESPHKDQWDLIFSLIWAWINEWVNNRDACDLRRHRTHYDVIVMFTTTTKTSLSWWACIVNGDAFSMYWQG